MARAIAEDADLPYVRIDPLRLNAELIEKRISRPFARKHRMIPLEMVDGRLRVALANPEHYKLMTGRPIADYDPPRDSLRFAASTMEPLVDAVRTACATGVLDGDPRTVAMRLWAAGHGRVSLELHGLVDVDDDEANEYFDRLIDAHRPR